MNEFEVNGVKYRSARMNAFEQFHVFRKLAPVLGAAGSLADIVKSGDGASAGVNALLPLAQAIADLPEDDCNVVFEKCLAMVEREQKTAVGAAWAKVWSPSAKRLMFDDIDDAISMVQITVAVIQDNIGNFSSAPLSR